MLRTNWIKVDASARVYGVKRVYFNHATGRAPRNKATGTHKCMTRSDRAALCARLEHEARVK